MSKCPLLLVAVTLAACGGSTPEPRPTAKPIAAVEPPPPRPVAMPDPDAVPLPLWPEVHKGKLSNGLTYYTLKHGKPEKRAMLWLAVNAGSVDEDDDQRGLAHLAEHMAFNGTTRFPKNDLIKYLEGIGMRFGADLNAYTTWQQTVYQLEVPTDDPKFVDKGFDILRDWAGNVIYDASEVGAPGKAEKERGVVLEEWRLGRGSFIRLFDKQAPVLFKGTRYANRNTIGDPEIIKNAPRDTLYRFYKDWYRPDQMAVIVVGEIDPAAIESQIKARFGDLVNPAHERTRVTAGVPAADGTRVSIETDKEVPATSVAIFNLVAHRPNASRRDYRRFVVEQVYQAIVNERLDTIRRRSDAPFLNAFTSIGGQTREIDAYTRRAQVKNGQIEDTLKSLLTEALRVERHGFTQAELDRARAIVQRSAEEGEARDATSDSRLYTDEITRNYFEAELLIGRTAEKQLTLEFLPLITIAELNADVKSFGGAENRVIAISGPEGKPVPTKDRVLQIVGEVEKSEIQKWEDKPIPATVMAKPPEPGKIVKENKLDAIDVTEWTLSNGVRVIVKPTDYERDTVLVTAESPGGTATVADAAFRDARFATAIAATGGAGELDAETLGKVLAGKQVQAFTSIGETSEGVSASASPRDLELMFQLIHLRITAPRKDAQQFAVWKASSAEQIQNQQRSPEFQYFKQAQEALYKNHPRRSLPMPEDFAKVDLDKALGFYRDRFGDAADFTFVIVGEVDLAKLRPLVETYLASLPAKGRKEKEKDLGIRKIAGVVKKQWKLGVEPKASVRIDFHADEAWSKDKERDMQILGQVLTIRLRELLREDKGGVYGVGANGSIARSPHPERNFSVSFGCDPTRVEELVKAAEDEIAAVKKAGIGEEYLDKVKRTYERSRETELRTNRFWLNRLTAAYQYGDDPTEIPDTTKTVARMTSPNVKAAAIRFLDPKQVYEAVRLPEK
jgi:zinc protease